MFKGFTLKDWVIGYFTLGIWILYKMHKNGVPIKVLGGFVGVIVLIGVLGGIFGDKDKNKSSNTETETVVAEKKVDNAEKERLAKEKAEADRIAKEEEAKKKAETVMEEKKNQKYSPYIKGSENCDGNNDFVCNLLTAIYDDNAKYSDGSPMQVYFRYTNCEILVDAAPMPNFGVMIKNNNDVHKVCLKLMDKAIKEQMQEYGDTLIKDKSIMKMNQLKELVGRY